MLPTKEEIKVLRELGKQLYEIASTDYMKEVCKSWVNLNGMRPDRPMMTISQLPWNELTQDGTLECVCTDPYWRGREEQMRQELYKYRYFRADMIIRPYFEVTKVVHGIHNMGVSSKEDIAVFEEGNSVVGHYFYDCLDTDEAVDALKAAPITYNEELTQSRLAEAREIFDGVMPVRLSGVSIANNIWDRLSNLRGVETPLYDMIERPEFIHKTMTIFTEAYLGHLDSLEEMGLLGYDQTEVHCTGALTDELPKPGFDPDHVRACDVWTFGLAQMLSTVSPAMFEEFEIDYVKRWCERFGLVYYGCCDPLDLKMEQVRKLPNLRKVSMSPWTSAEIGAAAIAGDYVFSAKPNPAHLAAPTFDEAVVRAELENIKAACDKNGCPVEFILKDVSTVRHDYTRLVRWEQIASEVSGKA